MPPPQKLAFTYLLTSKLFGFNFVIHALFTYNVSRAVSGHLLRLTTLLSYDHSLRIITIYEVTCVGTGYSTVMGDRVRVQFPLRDYLFRYVTSHPDQLSLAIPSCVGAMSTSQRAVTLCGWGVKAGMVHVWVTGKTVWSHCYTRAISERFRDKGLIYKALYKFICLLFTFYENLLYRTASAHGKICRGAGGVIKWGVSSHLWWILCQVSSKFLH